MDILFLGTGAGVPGKARNVSSLALKLLDELNEVWLFDCGEATQHQILHTQLKPRKLSKIFITHLHGDHIFGLPGLLSSRSFQGGKSPVDIYGPPGIRKYVEMSLQLSKSHLLYPLRIHELDPQGGHWQTEAGWTIDYLPLAHSILCFGYRIQQADQPGELLVDRLREYQIPSGPVYGALKRGEVVTLDDGRQVDGRDFIAPAKPGRIITILGDTKPCKNIYQLAQGADVLVHESTHAPEEAKMANQYYHSTAAQAAELAQAAGVKQVYLNHISHRYLQRDVRQMEATARKIHPQLRIVADLEEYPI